MTKTIDKVEARHSKNEMTKRDGETGMAVGLFIVALGLPVLVGTFFALDTPRAAFVNGLCGFILLLIGGSAIAYGWRLFSRAKKNEKA